MIILPDSIGTLLFKDKQVRILSLLTTQNREWHISDLAREANVTYLHTSKFIKKCEDYGIITSEKHGRTKKLVLTEKGILIARSVASIKERLESNDQPIPKPQQVPPKAPPIVPK